MNGGKFTLEQLKNPPQKVLLMFDAVTEMIKRCEDLSKITVQEITARAGIGKGTAYEYFSSKEELITVSVIFDCGKRVGELTELVYKQQTFEERMYSIMDWLNNNQGYHETFLRLVQIGSKEQSFCTELKQHISGDIFKEMSKYLVSQCDNLLELGAKEKLFTEMDASKRRMAFIAMLVQVILVIGQKEEQSFFVMDYEGVRSFAYQSMIKALN